MTLLLEWLVLSIAVWVAAAVVPGVRIKGLGSAVVVAGLFGVLNFLLGWLVFGVIGVATLGLGFLLAFVTRWIVNALLLLLTAALSSRIQVRGFGRALLAALVMAAVGTIGQWLLGLR